MIAPRVQIYVQPTPYTIGELMRGSYVTIRDSDEQVLQEYRAGTSVQFGVGPTKWPISVSINLPGFDLFRCELAQFGRTSIISTGEEEYYAAV